MVWIIYNNRKTYNARLQRVFLFSQPPDVTSGLLAELVAGLKSGTAETNACQFISCVYACAHVRACVFRSHLLEDIAKNGTPHYWLAKIWELAPSVNCQQGFHAHYLSSLKMHTHTHTHTHTIYLSITVKTHPH